jgi:phosphoribosylamine--glycine ligase
LKPGIAKADPRSAAAVVAVSGGYPGDYEKGLPIQGLQTVLSSDALLFHAGTTEKDGEVVTNGGRVLVLTAFGENVSAAAASAVLALQNFRFQGMYFRTDIGYEFESGTSTNV